MKTNENISSWFQKMLDLEPKKEDYIKEPDDLENDDIERIRWKYEDQKILKEFKCENDKKVMVALKKFQCNYNKILIKDRYSDEYHIALHEVLTGEFIILSTFRTGYSNEEHLLENYEIITEILAI